MLNIVCSAVFMDFNYSITDPMCNAVVIDDC